MLNVFHQVFETNTELLLLILLKVSLFLYNHFILVKQLKGNAVCYPTIHVLYFLYRRKSAKGHTVCIALPLNPQIYTVWDFKKCIALILVFFVAIGK